MNMMFGCLARAVRTQESRPRGIHMLTSGVGDHVIILHVPGHDLKYQWQQISHV